MRLALAQMNVVVGDLDGNSERIVATTAAARELEADLVVFPELAVTGYPPEDLLLRPGFVAAAREALDDDRPLVHRHHRARRRAVVRRRPPQLLRRPRRR